MYCAFIDFEKAFDSIWQLGLWNKVLLNNIDGKCFNVITQLYKGIKSRVVTNGLFSDSFSCTVGVRQGENLSPFLFALYLNDLEDFLYSNNVLGLSFISTKLEKEFDLYLKLFVLLYADDTILLSESPEDLQYQLDVFNDYCTCWHLKVNTEKTKVVIFGKGNVNMAKSFMLSDRELEIVDTFRYLGVLFCKNGSFHTNIKEQFQKATNAMYGVIGKCRKHNLSVDCMLDMFDKIVKPVLLYGCEIWGFNQSPLLEKLHLKFCKHILHLKSSTPNFMIYGELGRYPISINIKVRMISFWCKLVNSQGDKLSSTLFGVLRKYNNKWCNYIKSILNDCGLPYIWQTMNPMNPSSIKKAVFEILYNQFHHSWYSDMNNSSKGLNYRIFKTSFCLENYLLSLPYKHLKYFCRFRTCNVKLPIEVGRWLNIPRENRICNLCLKNEIGDEYHYLFNCNDSCIVESRLSNISKYFYLHPNVYKFEKLFNTKNKTKLIRLCKFIKTIVERVSSPG